MTSSVPVATLRLDKWLWHARFFKSRSFAAEVCQSGKLRVNGEPTQKAHYALRVGDVLTLPIGMRIRIVRVLGLGERRGPAPEAQLLYDDLSPPEAARPQAPARSPQRERGAGRPTKAERRAIDRLMDDE